MCDGFIRSLNGMFRETAKWTAVFGKFVVRPCGINKEVEKVFQVLESEMADQISDAVLDAILTQDKYGRVACETLVTTGMVLVVGEITTMAQIDIPQTL